jgi:NNP family nitrate/nitrite transporter-like MFS transporter
MHMKKKENINDEWMTIVMLTFIFFLNFMGRMIFSPLLPNIEADLGINHAQAGTFFFFMACGYFISLAGSAFVSSIIQHRCLIVFSAMVLGLTLPGISFCHDLKAVRVGLFIVGLVTGLYLPSAIATLTAGIPPHRWGKAIAIHELAPNLVFILAPILSEIFLQWFSWRGVVSLMGGISLLLGIIFMWKVKDGAFRGDPPGWETVRRIQSDSAFWIMIVLFSLGASGTLGIYAMLPLYLVDVHEMDQTWVNTFFALSRVGSLVTALIGGWAADRFGIRQTLALTLSLSGMLTILLGMGSASWIVACMFLQPLPAVAFFPAAFASLASIGPSGTRNIVISLTVPIAFLMGGGVVPMLIGIMGHAGYFPAGFWLTGMMMLAGGMFAFRWAWCGSRSEKAT